MPEPIVHKSPEIMSGTPVFYGTRVPIQNLTDYLVGGSTIDEFLDDFPTVSKKQVMAFLESATELIVAHTDENSA